MIHLVCPKSEKRVAFGRAVLRQQWGQDKCVFFSSPSRCRWCRQRGLLTSFTQLHSDPVSPYAAVQEPVGHNDAGQPGARAPILVERLLLWQTHRWIPASKTLVRRYTNVASVWPPDNKRHTAVPGGYHRPSTNKSSNYNGCWLWWSCTALKLLQKFLAILGNVYSLLSVY